MAINIKICGITTEEDACMAINAGANSIGIIIGESRSPRSITTEMARQIMSCVPSYVTKVVVTPGNSIEEIIEIQKAINPDVIQLQEEHPLEFLEKIKEKLKDTKLIGVLPLEMDSRFEDILPKIKNMEYLVDAIIFDSRASNGRIGGSGNIHNWKLSREIRDFIYPKPAILAGGLTPENVSRAIHIVQPWGVDVASGVEYNKNGRKNPLLVCEFIRMAKRSR